MNEVKEGMIKQTLGDWGREEEAFAVALGLKREKLSSLRKEHLEEGEHWGKVSGRITYRVGGEVKMRGVVALMLGLEGDEIEVDEQVGREELEELEVRKTFPVNRRLIECEREGGELVRVNVGNSENFLKGMKLKARPPWGEGRLWVMVGRKPRWRGRW